jgi:hypothetical protein
VWDNGSAPLPDGLSQAREANKKKVREALRTFYFFRRVNRCRIAARNSSVRFLGAIS